MLTIVIALIVFQRMPYAVNAIGIIAAVIATVPMVLEEESKAAA